MRSTVVALVAMILAMTGSACGDAGRPPAAPAPARPATTSAAERSIPVARLIASRHGSQRGRLLAWHWLVASRLEDHAPVGGVRWPAPLRVPARRALELRVQTANPPTRVEARIFSEDVDARGAPRSSGRLEQCRREPGSACRFVRRDGAIDVRLAVRDRRPRLVALYCEWYVPVGQRPPGTESNPVVSASWGFRLRG